MKNQIMVSNQNTLNQFFRLMDSVAEEMRNICISIASDSECANYSYYAANQPSRTSYQSLVVKEQLDSYRNERYQDVFVYFPVDGGSSAIIRFPIEYPRLCGKILLRLSIGGILCI